MTLIGEVCTVLQKVGFPDNQFLCAAFCVSDTTVHCNDMNMSFILASLVVQTIDRRGRPDVYNLYDNYQGPPAQIVYMIVTAYEREFKHLMHLSVWRKLLM